MLPARVGTDILARRAPIGLDPGHHLAHAPNMPCCPPKLCLCAQQPSAPSLRAPSPSGRLPEIRIKPPTGRAGASQALQPLACPSPYLLPPRRLPPSLAFDSPARPNSGSPQTRPRPAPARPPADSSPRIRPRPPVNTPPLTPL